METKNSFISSASVKVQGRTAYYKMLEAVRQGELIQVCRGVYANIDQLSACMVDIESIVPNGILCLWSAWNIHQLTTSMPQAYHVAIKRDRKVKVPSFPKIELHHYTSNILEIGVMEKIIDGFKVKALMAVGFEMSSSFIISSMVTKTKPFSSALSHKNLKISKRFAPKICPHKSSIFSFILKV